MRNPQVADECDYKSPRPPRAGAPTIDEGRDWAASYSIRLGADIDPKFRSRGLAIEPPRLGSASLGLVRRRDRCLKERAVPVGAVVPTHGQPAGDHEISELAFLVYVPAKGQIREGALAGLAPALRYDA